MVKRLVCGFAVLTTIGAVGTVAIAAQPEGSGYYGGTFKNKRGYVAVYVQQNRKIFSARLQYSCNGKGAAIGSPAKFQAVPISSTGRFVVSFKAPVMGESGQKIATGRVRVVGRFPTSKSVRGVARVKSAKCPRKRGRFTGTGPQNEG